jgi:hypothetical protein
MRALAVAVSVIVGVMGSTAAPVRAGEVLRATELAPNPFAMTPPPAPLVPRPTVPVPVGPPPGHHRPPPVIGYPCCPSGYWAYQWVPTTSITYVWVPGYVTEDGTMVAGGYQPRAVSGGYYQPVWVSGY